MGFQLLSISYKTAPLDIRSCFSFTEDQQQDILKKLKASGMVEEAVIVSTCNRTELYCYSDNEMDNRRMYTVMRDILVKQSGILGAAGAENADIGDYIRLYEGKKAVRHLFQVTAGMDSMVLGEDQILGQVKRAGSLAKESGTSGVYMNTLFRMAITGAKKVKTDTILSKSSVSTATLALKAAEEHLGSLKNKNLLIIGASGKIGGIVFKNALSMGCGVYATSRAHDSCCAPVFNGGCFTIPYEDRYRYLEQMDAVISATNSPHYTITRNHYRRRRAPDRTMVFVDLAVPMDIEPDIGEEPGTYYYNIDNMKQLAQENNRRKQADLENANRILEDYEEEFDKWLVFQNNRDDMDLIKDRMEKEAGERGTGEAVQRFFYKLKKHGSAREMEAVMSVIQKINHCDEG